MPQPPPSHPSTLPPRVGVLLINLGTPDAPTSSALRRFLKSFLLDPRVVELPAWLWQPVLYGVILPIRAVRSAKKYASIWSTQGSPLKIFTAKQAELLQQKLGHDVIVRYAMTHSEPFVKDVLIDLKACGVDRLLIFPLYPQYASSSTGSAIDAVLQTCMQWRVYPSLRIRRGFHDDVRYISALADVARRHAKPDHHWVMSFHGIPQRSFERGDPYHCLCHKTARLLAEHLDLTSDDYSIGFQSRLGRTEWLRPYIEDILDGLLQQGKRKIQLIAPAFVSDCLETLEELNIALRRRFLQQGGESFHYIPCINETPEWLHALEAMVKEELHDWYEG